MKRIYTNILKFLKLFILMALMVSCAKSQKEPVTLTILHTNDTHSQIEPKSDGTGGYARRMGLIQQERELDTDLILVDAGDFSQGSPYFNFFHGRVEIDALNRMGYDVGILGNHEFDNGVDTLAEVLKLAQFPIVCANYEVTGTKLEGIIKPYTILERKGLKIGVFGLGVNPIGPIAPDNFAPVKYHYPLQIANNIAKDLREKKNCDLVICLSHLGTLPTAANDTTICDSLLAVQSRNIDMIIGGHTHKLINDVWVQNLDGKQVLLSQMGKAGSNIGKIQVNLVP